MKFKTLIIAYVLFAMLFASCAPTETPFPPTPTPVSGPSQVSILTPASGAVLPLAPVNIEFEGASFSGITEFEVRVDGSVQATVPPSSSSSCGANCGTKFFGEYLWSPPSTGIYTIALRALGNGLFSPSSEVEITIENVVLEKATPLPLLPTPTATSLSIKIPEKVVVVGLKNGNCREGGGNQYEIVDALMKDQSADAVAVSEDGFYVKIIGPNWKVECWVWIELVNVEQGDVKGLPVEPYPPPPNPEPAQPQPEAPRPQPTSTPAGRP
jgi:hypothetical protein